MVIKLNKKLEVIKKDEPINLPPELKSQIEAFWEKQVRENLHLFNGQVWTVTSCEELSDRIRICIQKSNYAHYLFDERVGIDGQYGCYNLSCGILLETVDGYYVIGEMAQNTSYPGILQTSGGNLDQNDIRPDGFVDVQNTIARELKEELNIDLFDANVVEKYQMKYMEIPEGRMRNYPILMKGTLTMTAKEMQEYYSSYVQQLEEEGEEAEFARLHFIKREQAVEILKAFSNPKRHYVEGILDLDSREIEEEER